MSQIDDLLAHRHVTAQGVDLSHQPSRRIVIVTCMETKIDPYRVLGVKAGEVHLLRNAGGIPTPDVLRSLLVSQTQLGTREVMVIQHTSCGMMSFKGETLRDQVEKETGTRPPFSLRTFQDLKKSVQSGVKTIRKAGYLPHRDHVRGFVLDLQTWRLQEVT